MSHLQRIAQQGRSFPWLNPKEQTVLGHIADCCTGRLGSNVMGCACGHHEIHHNSCRDRHCPLCQGVSRAEWVAKRLKELLPCRYFHVVFTVPKALRLMAYANKSLFYQALFHSVHDTLLSVGANPENLGARLGGMSVLHTWNQKLAYHPHVHCIVPGGGVSIPGDRWINAEQGYLLPVRRLSVVFRGKLLSALAALHQQGKLYAPDPGSVTRQLRSAARQDFVVYAKAPFGGPAQVLKYLGRYTHRVGISDQRVIAFDGKTIGFTWIDRAHGHVQRTQELPLEGFLRKFLQHLIPKGIKKIRYFGYMANRDRSYSLDRVRSLIETSGQALKEQPPDDTLPNGQGHDGDAPDATTPSAGTPAPHRVNPCPQCGQRLELLVADRWRTHNSTLRQRIIQQRCLQGASPPPEPLTAG